MKNEIFILIIQLHLIIPNFAINEPGRKNTNYKIREYYGSRYLASSFRDDNPSIIYWSNGIFLKSTGDTLWIADSSDHTIKQIQDSKIIYLAGKSSTAGFRDGDYVNSILNNPKSVIYYESNNLYNRKTNLYKSYLFKNNSQDCLFADYKNYTNCVDIDINKIIKEEEIKKELVRLIYFPQNSSSESDLKSNINQKYLLISDTGNNCIRKLDLNTAEVSTYAGKCGTDNYGFKDGPYLINRFNKPDGIGIDDDGNLFVYDSGNNYMRMIKPDGYVVTLINGACFEYMMMPFVPNKFGVKNEYVLCFKNWIKTSGKPDDHILRDLNSDVCLKHIVECNVISPLIKK